MFSYIVTDDALEDREGAEIRMDDYGNMFLKCHPSIVEKVLEGMKVNIGITLEVLTKNEWEKENHRLFSKS